jgi:Arc/MetJ-type ribon-helix-helix transcriptional regulator
MKIVTVNVPESYIHAIEKLVGENGLYPSRSELIRVAVREFLLKEIKMEEAMKKFGEPEPEDLEDESIVKIPIKKINANGEMEYTGKKLVYKVIKRLEH